MARIEGSPQGPSSQGSFASDQMPAQAGAFRGEPVSVKDAASVLADAAEEISLHHSEKAENKKHEEREIEGEAPVQVMLIEQITAYLEAARAFSDPEKLAALAQRMQSSQENPRALARQQSRDPAQQYMLLQYALATRRDQQVPAEVQERLQDALADLEMESGPQIRAGLNTIGAAAEFGASAGDIAAFQDTYRDVVLGDNALARTLQLVLQRLAGREGEDLARGLAGLIKALGADLSAARPSLDVHRLQALVQDLYQLEVAVTVLDGCRDLARTLETRHDSRGLAAMALMKELVAVTGEPWVGAARFGAMADRFGLHEVGARIAFHMAAKTLLRQMPPAVFPDPDRRQATLDAAQEALDLAIGQEDA